jgi:hypothetical protein
MPSKYEYLKEIDEKIKFIERTSNELEDIGMEKEIPAIYNNTRRISALVKLLKLNVSDIIDFKL